MLPVVSFNFSDVVMVFKQEIFKILRILDRYSPMPLLYDFRMSENEIVLFEKKIKNSKSYLEFGMGGSLLRTILKSKAKIYSVDSSVIWIENMRKYQIVRRLLKKRLFLYHADIGPTMEWGYPIDNHSRELFPNYSANIFSLINKERIDRVLIDGRFRVACTLKTISECYKNRDLEILIHDFWDREEYHILLKYLHEVDRADTLGVFVIKTNFDLIAVMKDYDLYKYIPR